MDRSSSRIKRVAGVLFEEDQRCMLLFLLIYRFETSEVDRCRICLDRTSLKTYQSESYHPKGGVWGDSSAILHRLFHRLDTIQRANVLVVCAGMEGALASVVGGLVDKPVIAVPTSIGYGANFDGLSALLAMLNSCASGVSVVNIDNGFGAGFMAHTINCLGGKK